jgi:hypothetical protein
MTEATKPQGVAELLALLKEIRETNGGQPAPIDPTANVLKLVEQAMLRQDDLRMAESRRIDDLVKQDMYYREKLRLIEQEHMSARFGTESRRVDAVIAQQAANVSLASQRAELTATALAARVDESARALAERVDTSAKALAASVEATAKASAAAVDAQSKALADRIIPLEQFRYEQGGAKVQQSEGKSDNRWVIGIAISAPSFLLAVVALVYALTK